ncbi:hypothetical protein JB92DRAFT_155449 [Gautieria morchelliformis]|nr:hypothetical protein JB92DRAFT_155449 [Gautieria morchelliformis]
MFINGHLTHVHDVDNEVWTDMKAIGGVIQDLFVSLEDGSTALPPNMSLCFPNLVYLQIEISARVRQDPNSKHFYSLGQALSQLRRLECLVLCYTEICPLCLSPGKQHAYVHDIFQRNCPTLKTVIFGPWLIWHLRKLPARAEECHCEPELLSLFPFRTCTEQYKEVYPHIPLDWWVGGGERLSSMQPPARGRRKSGVPGREGKGPRLRR